MNKKPKVALCYPNFRWDQGRGEGWNTFPYVLCILASAIRDICDVEIIDAHKEGLSEEAFSRRMKEGNFDLVGISVPMDLFSKSAHLAAKLARQSLPAAVIVMGGVYAIMNPAEALNNNDVDYVCIGEGENTFPGLIRHIYFGEEMPTKGFSHRCAGEIAIQPRSDFIHDLDALPLPAYDLIDFESYAGWFSNKSMNRPLAFPYAEIMTSRGCPQSCSFCQAIKISGNRVRAKSAGKVLEEIAFLKQKYNIRSLIFTDDNLVAIRSRAVELFRGMAKPELLLPWKAMSMAVFRLDEELLGLMAESGCKSISISVESGSPRVLKEIIHKPLDLEHAKKMTTVAKSLGIFVAVNFVIGLPGETWDEIRQTFRYSEELGADYARFMPVVPLRNTKLWEQCEAEDAFVDGFDADAAEWYRGYVKSPHFDSRELTLLAVYEWDRINFSSLEQREKIAEVMGVTLDELEAMRKASRRQVLERVG